MPKSFEEFTSYDMEQIRIKVETVIDLNDIVGNLRSVRIDHNSEYHVLEYKRQKQIILDGNNYNNPDASINIKNDFSCIIHGFNPNQSSMISHIVDEYLKKLDFVR